MIVRVVKGKPENHWEVWLISAPLMALCALVGGLAAALIYGEFDFNRFLWSLPLTALFFVSRGAIESYRLDQRRNAANHPEIEGY